MKEYNEKCIIAVGSMTFALKGQKLFGQNNIVSSVTHLAPSMTRHGCAYGIVLDCRYTKNSVALLSENGIRYSEVIKTGGEKY